MRSLDGRWRTVVLGVLVCVVSTGSLPAQTVKVLPQVNLRRHGAPAADYSGITRIGTDRYALVSDKAPVDGYYPLRLRIDSLTGRVLSVAVEPLRPVASQPKATSGYTSRDVEGVAYMPGTGTLFISGEGDQEIREYDLEGAPTGRKLRVPPVFGKACIHPNYGFEALTYDPVRERFWTTTENVLRADGHLVSPRNPQSGLLRLQSFGRDLQPGACYAYLTDRPEAERTGRAYAFGVSALTAMLDGSLLVLEREFYVARRYWGSWVQVKIYRVRPSGGEPLTASAASVEEARRKVLPKQLVAEWKSRFNAVNTRLANYEGMCLGPCLADGRQTLVLVSDSQGGAGRAPYRLKDFLRVIIVPPVVE